MGVKKALRYPNWIKEQIDILKEIDRDVANSSSFSLKKIPFRVCVPLEENPGEPEYVVQFLTKQNIDKSGLWIEAGVWKGEMINRVARNNPDKTIYGFDSFEGFPDDGRPEGDWDYPGFNLNGTIPTSTTKGQNFAPNTTLIKGWFKDTMPPFLKEQNEKISFISIDCDIYSSTKDVLESIKDYITDETIIALDDAWHYDGFLDHQLKALYEFITKYGYMVKWICYRGEIFDFERLDERKGISWGWRSQFKWRKSHNYSDCALYLIKV